MVWWYLDFYIDQWLTQKKILFVVGWYNEFKKKKKTMLQVQHISQQLK